MTPTEKESLMLASSHFLSKELPKNFDKWSEKKVNDYCQNNAWEPFQYYEGSEIYEHIDRLSDDFINFKKWKEDERLTIYEEKERYNTKQGKAE